MHKTVVAAVLMTALTGHAWAHGGERVVYDQVDLSASAEREVDNDVLVAFVYTEQEGQRQADVAERVNEAMQWALEQAKAAAGVNVQTTQYNTYPVYASNSSTITGWRARQSLKLESKDPKAVSDLLGALQEKLAVESVDYRISKEARDRAEEALTAEALGQFQARAQQIAAALSRSGYRIVRLNIGTGGNYPGPVAYHGKMLAAEGAAAPAVLEAGAQSVNVTVSGTIQLEARQ